MRSVNRPHGRGTDSNPDDVTASNRTGHSPKRQLTNLTSMDGLSERHWVMLHRRLTRDYETHPNQLR
jgi:hypothetical protein